MADQVQKSKKSHDQEPQEDLPDIGEPLSPIPEECEEIEASFNMHEDAEIKYLQYANIMIHLSGEFEDTSPSNEQPTLLDHDS